eukprot:CAMPEP_0171460008 /NCGR_PEP_ID=MMETSP0945-20130129/5050_1 /TAXON_ID=109269 /ORGANISM="Vaucheria litorea, Strain CCMP2940" /LENGTH=144 /DNA_ID=CAMNT_0011986113 /DNA_START=69 /DNA_END=503 /DNA_ORIENTATION=-
MTKMKRFSVVLSSSVRNPPKLAPSATRFGIKRAQPGSARLNYSSGASSSSSSSSSARKLGRHAHHTELGSKQGLDPELRKHAFKWNTNEQFANKGLVKDYFSLGLVGLAYGYIIGIEQEPEPVPPHFALPAEEVRAFKASIGME